MNKYLVEFSKHKPKELKVIVIDNAGFHSLQQYDIPENIRLIRIPPYSPELNPSEKLLTLPCLSVAVPRNDLKELLSILF